MKKQWLICLVTLSLMILPAMGFAETAYPTMPPLENLVHGYCSRVVDGDTVYLEIVDEGIPVAHMYRLIGVDTPETVHPHLPVQPLGPEASQYTTEALLNRLVYIEYDVEKTDHYQRHLGYVWLEDGTMFNLLLLEKGFGRFLVIPPNVKYSAFLLEAQKKAQRETSGIWSALMSEVSRIDLTAMSKDDLLDLKLKIEGELLKRDHP